MKILPLILTYPFVILAACSYQNGLEWKDLESKTASFPVHDPYYQNAYHIGE